MADEQPNDKQKEPPIVVTVTGSMAEIMDASDVEYATVEGFSKGKTIRIGSLTAGDLIEWSEANEGEAKRTAGLRLITKSLVSEDGRRYADDPKNIQVFRLKSHKVCERIVREILKLNGMNVKAEAEAKKD